jgi:hypothetical protein
MRHTSNLARTITILITIVITLALLGAIYNTTYAAIATTPTPTATLVPPYHALTMNGKMYRCQIIGVK